MDISHIINEIDKDFNNVNIYFPKLEANFDVIENNICHNHEKLYDHVFQVYKNLLEIYDKINDKKQLKINLLKLSVIFHDVGKIYVLKKDHNDVTSCSNHEMESLSVFRQNIKYIQGLSEEDILWVEKFILNHSKIHLACDKSNSEFENIFNKFMYKFPDMYNEMLIFGYCDLYKSFLMVSNASEYEYRMRLFNKKMTDLQLYL